MTIDTSLFAKGLVTQHQLGELICDYDSNTQIIATKLDELDQRLSVLESIIENAVNG